MSYICVVTCMKPKPTIGLKYFPEKTVGQVQSGLIAKIGRPTAPWYENSVSYLIITILPHPQARTRIHSHMHSLLYRPTCTYLKIQTHSLSYLHLIKDALSFRSINPSTRGYTAGL